MTPLQFLPTVSCTVCPWERRSQRENAAILLLAARAHTTETEGHLVEWAPRSSVRAEVAS